MEDKMMQQVIRIIANDEGCSEEEVYEAMCQAIDDAYTHEDVSIRERWHKIPHLGEKPTPQEVIAYFAEMLETSV